MNTDGFPYVIRPENTLFVLGRPPAAHLPILNDLVADLGVDFILIHLGVVPDAIVATPDNTLEHIGLLAGDGHDILTELLAQGAYAYLLVHAPHPALCQYSSAPSTTVRGAPTALCSEICWPRVRSSMPVIAGPVQLVARTARSERDSALALVDLGPRP